MGPLSVTALWPSPSRGLPRAVLALQGRRPASARGVRWEARRERLVGARCASAVAEKTAGEEEEAADEKFKYQAKRLVISQETRSARHAAARRPVAPGRGRRAGGHVHCRQVLLLQGLRHWRPRELPQARVYPEGTHIVIPWFERPIIYDVRTRPNLVESTSGSRDLQMVPTRGIGLRCGCTRGC